jgi:hypothetical protein
MAQSFNLNSGFPNSVWYSDSLATDTIGYGQLFNTEILEKDTAFYFDFTIDQKPPIYIGSESITRVDPESGLILPAISLSLNFELSAEINLHSVTVYALQAGIRKFQIAAQESFDIVYEKSIFVDAGIQEIILDAQLDMGKYVMMTDQETNMENFSINSALFGIIDKNIAYPYYIGNHLVKITRSLIGINHYPYFFDWKVSPVLDECHSDIYRYTLDYDPIQSTIDLASIKLDIFPNPSDDFFHIVCEKIMTKLEVYNFQGQLLLTKEINGTTFKLHTDHLKGGSYILKMTTADGIIVSPIVKY